MSKKIKQRGLRNNLLSRVLSDPEVLTLKHSPKAMSARTSPPTRSSMSSTVRQDSPEFIEETPKGKSLKSSHILNLQIPPGFPSTPSSRGPITKKKKSVKTYQISLYKSSSGQELRQKASPGKELLLHLSEKATELSKVQQEKIELEGNINFLQNELAKLKLENKRLKEAEAQNMKLQAQVMKLQKETEKLRRENRTRKCAEDTPEEPKISMTQGFSNLYESMEDFRQKLSSLLTRV